MNPSIADVAEPKQSADTRVGNQFTRPLDFSPTTSAARRYTTALILGVTAIALGFGLRNLFRQLAPQITPPVSQESAYVASFPEKSIAVLPFKDLNGADEGELLAESVQDDLITALSRVAELRVISSTSVSGYTPDKARDLREIAQSLGAGHLLEGTVRRSGKKVRIITQLTDARRGASLWSLTYERDINDVFGMQSQIVQQIASQLHANISPEEKEAIVESPTHDLAAYGLYVRAKALIASVANAQINEKLMQAVQLLDQAIARDRDFYRAWCQLGAAHDYIYFFGFDHTPARLALAETALKTIIRLRPDAGETHLAKANFLYRCHLDYDKARGELALTQRALPNCSEVFELTGYIDRRQGYWAESERSLHRAVQLDPRNSFLLQQIAASYQEFRQFRAMSAALDRALALAPHDLDARVTRAFVDLEWRADTRPLRRTIDALLSENPDSTGDFADQWLYVALCERDFASVARALAAIPTSGISPDLNFPRAWCEALAARAKGDATAAQTAFLTARSEVEKTVREQPDYGPGYTVLGLIDAGLGRKQDAMREGRLAVELLPITKDSIDGAELMKYLGVIYAWCGEKELALQQIAATLKIPNTLSYGNFKLHPFWDPLRGDARFEKILADLAPKDLEE